MSQVVLDRLAATIDIVPTVATLAGLSADPSDEARVDGIDLTAAAAPHLSFYGWVYTEGSSYDGFNLKVSTDCSKST